LAGEKELEEMTGEKSMSNHVCECQICKSGTDAALIRRHRHINLLLSRLTEPQRRWYVATLADAPDSPGDRQLALITGLDEKTIRRGKAEIASELSDLPNDRQRKEGGGRQAAEKKIKN
jgi:cobalamin biosynthesis protein CbiG